MFIFVQGHRATLTDKHCRIILLKCIDLQKKYVQLNERDDEQSRQIKIVNKYELAKFLSSQRSNFLALKDPVLKFLNCSSIRALPSNKPLSYKTLFPCRPNLLHKEDNYDRILYKTFEAITSMRFKVFDY